MFRVGLNCFGGPVAQIGVMRQEAVERRRWLSDGQVAHLLNFANVLPGPEALEIAIHLGYLRRGMAGGIVAGVPFDSGPASRRPRSWPCGCCARTST